jgi:hypothetical protein
MSTFRPRRPSPALVVSFIALLVALGGTSYAAFSPSNSSVGTKQLKNGAVGTLKLKNGAVGTAKLQNGAVTTAKLKNGAVTALQLNVTGVTVPNALHANAADNATNATNATNAANATNATNAANATNAKSAASPTTLGSGATETGSYAIDYTAAAAHDDGLGVISFAFPLASDPSVGGALSPDFLPAGGASTTDCPGTVANPKAVAGHLCVYESYGENHATNQITEMDNSWTDGQADKYGAGVYVTASAAGRVVSVGTWAVTAP